MPSLLRKPKRKKPRKLETFTEIKKRRADWTRRINEPALDESVEEPEYITVEHVSYLFNNNTFSDVRFIVGRGENQRIIPGHRSLLSEKSVLFRAIFEKNKEKIIDEIAFPYEDPVEFLKELKTMYTYFVVHAPFEDDDE